MCIIQLLLLTFVEALKGIPKIKKTGRKREKGEEVLQKRNINSRMQGKTAHF
jgi:hypothetical protein